MTVTYDSYLGIPYFPDQATPDSRQVLDLFVPTSAEPSCRTPSDPLPPLVVYIHGGAWRSEAVSDFYETLVPSFLSHLSLPLALFEYRLAPDHPHPAQTHDVLSALSLLLSPSFPHRNTFDPSRIYLVGHSAGAFLSAACVLADPTSGSYTVPAALRAAIQGVVLVDGIFDLKDLLAEYPTYDYFVHDAFGKDPEFLASESPSNLPLPSVDGDQKTKFLVLHSKEDELLTLRQPEGFVRHLKECGLKVGGGRVEVDYDSLKEGHWGLLKRHEMAIKVAEWMGRQ